MADDEIDVRVRLKETARFHQDSRRAAQDVDQITESEKRSGDASEDAAKKHKKLNVELNILKRVVGLIKPAALITGLGLAAQAASALAAGGIALGAALAPLGGLLVAYPALAGALGQGLGVVKLAMSGVTDAVGGLNEKMDDKKLAALTPPAQRFAKTLDSLKKPVIGLQQAAQKGLFPGFTNALKSIRPLIKEFHDEFELTGMAIGGVAAQGGRLLSSGPFSRDLQAQAKTNAVWIGTLGTSALNIVDALRNVTRAAEPLVSWLVRLAYRTSILIQNWAQTNRQSGALARFFGETRRVATILGRTLFSLTHGLVNVGKAAYPLGLFLLRTFQQAAKAFDDWTGSVKGQNELRQFFARARAPLLETLKLIRDLGVGLLKLGTGTQVAPMIRTIRTQLLPVLLDMVESTTKAFGPHLIAMLVEVTKLFATIAGSSGPLVVFVDLLTSAMRILNWMLDNVPGLKPVFVTIVGAIGVIKALSWANAIRNVTGLSAAFKRLGINAGIAAGAERGAAAAGTGGGFLGIGGGGKPGAGRVSTTQGLKGKVGAFGAGAAAGAGPIGIAAIAKMAYDSTIGKLKSTITNIIPEGVGRDLGGAVLDAVTFDLPGVAKHMVNAFQHVFSTTKIKAKVELDRRGLPGLRKDIEKVIAAQRDTQLRPGDPRKGETGGIKRLRVEYGRLLRTVVNTKKGTEEHRRAVLRLQRQQAQLYDATHKTAGGIGGYRQKLSEARSKLDGLTRSGKGASDQADKLRGKIFNLKNHINDLKIVAGNAPASLDEFAAALLRVYETNPPAAFRYGRERGPAGGGHQHGGTVQTSGMTLVGERGPEMAWLGRGTVVQSAQETRQRMRAPAPVSVGGGGPFVIEAHHDIQIGSDTIYKHVTRQAAKVRRAKSRSLDG